MNKVFLVLSLMLRLHEARAAGPFASEFQKSCFEHLSAIQNLSQTASARRGLNPAPAFSLISDVLVTTDDKNDGLTYYTNSASGSIEGSKCEVKRGNNLDRGLAAATAALVRLKDVSHFNAGEKRLFLGHVSALRPCVESWSDKYASSRFKSWLEYFPAGYFDRKSSPVTRSRAAD